MARIILAVIGGFIAWTILWIGSNAAYQAISPGWFGAHEKAFQAAFAANGPFQADTTVMLLSLVTGIVVTLACGFLAALIARENRKAPLVLGILLLVVGIAFQAMAWKYIPIWYHLIFLLMLVPMTIAGGKLWRGSNVHA